MQKANFSSTHINILIADDHAVVRQGLKQLLADTHGMVVRGEASNDQEVLEKVRTGDWNVVILDISMPGRGGLDVLKEIKRERPGLPVLVFSMYAEDQYAERVLRAGGSGYVTKDCTMDELIRAIRKVCAGGKYVSPQLAEKFAFDLEGDSDKSPLESLSDREYDVMRRIASGKTVKEIANDLSLSVKTISTYRGRLLRKLKLRNNAEVMHYAIQNRLVD
jgi:DNA-binding NarL/FixJ family response regulator